MDDKLYQQIFNIISKFLPRRWEKIACYFRYKYSSYSFKFYVKEKDSCYKQCYDYKIDEVELGKAFEQIFDLLSGKNVKTTIVLTLLVNRQGEIKAEYDYDNEIIDKSWYKYEQAWVKKFLVA